MEVDVSVFDCWMDAVVLLLAVLDNVVVMVVETVAVEVNVSDKLHDGDFDIDMLGEVDADCVIVAVPVQLILPVIVHDVDTLVVVVLVAVVDTDDD